MTKEDEFDNRITNLESCVKDVTENINDIKTVVIRLEERQNSSLETLKNIESAVKGNGKPGLVTSVAILEKGIEENRKEIIQESVDRKTAIDQITKAGRTESGRNTTVWVGLIAALMVIVGLIFLK